MSSVTVTPKPMSATQAQTGKDVPLVEMLQKFSPEAYAAIREVAANVYGYEKFNKLSLPAQDKKISFLFRECALKSLVAKRNSKLTGEYNKEAKDVDSLVDSGMSRKDAEIEVWGITGTQRRRVLDLAKKQPLF